MPPGSRYGKRSAMREEVFISFYATIQEQSRLRKKLAHHATTFLAVTPMVFLIGITLGVNFLWTGKGFAAVDGVDFLGILLILTVTTLLIVNIVLIVRGNIKPSEKSIARKIFTPDNFKTCDASAIRNYTLVSPVVREAIRKNLSLTENHISYMQSLASDGYVGSFYDLCETVKKL